MVGFLEGPNIVFYITFLYTPEGLAQKIGGLAQGLPRACPGACPGACPLFFKFLPFRIDVFLVQGSKEIYAEEEEEEEGEEEKEEEDVEEKEEEVVPLVL